MYSLVLSQPVDKGHLIAGPLDSDPQWHTLDKVSSTATQSKSTVIVRTAATSGSYVVKSDARILQEIFAGHLALVLGIRIPRMRVVTSMDMEWMLLQIGIDTFLSAEGNDIVMSAPENSAVAILMEFVPSLRILPDAGIVGAFPSLQSQTQHAGLCHDQTLLHIGMIIAFDLLINNSDRIPVANVWDNEGNFGNLLFTEANCGFSVVAIDQVLVPLKIKSIEVVDTLTCDPMMTRYTQRVESFLIQVSNGRSGGQRHVDASTEEDNSSSAFINKADAVAAGIDSSDKTGEAEDNGDRGVVNTTNSAVEALKSVRQFLKRETG